MVREIVASMEPIHLDAVSRQVAERHGWKRVGARIRARVEVATKGLSRTRETTGDFLWRNPPEHIVEWREIPGRDPAEISIAELAGLLRKEKNIIQTDDHTLALARRLG